MFKIELAPCPIDVWQTTPTHFYIAMFPQLAMDYLFDFIGHGTPVERLEKEMKGGVSWISGLSAVGSDKIRSVFELGQLLLDLVKSGSPISI